MFTKLQGVRLADLDTVLAAFSDEDWEQLDSEHIRFTAHNVQDDMDFLGAHPDDDGVLAFIRIYQQLLRRDEEARR
jgi:hypothetical protein